MHGYRVPDHEVRIAQLAREIGFTQVSTSHETSPMIKFVGRGDTTVADAYLSPILRRYIDRIAATLGGVNLQFMQSNGGLKGPACFRERMPSCRARQAALSARCARPNRPGSTR